MKRITLFFILLLLSSCVGNNHAMIMPDKNFMQYKTAYIELLSVDEFNLGTAIIQELGDMGLQAVNKPKPPNPLTTDMYIKYSYLTGWDLAKYLQSFQIMFLDAQTDIVIATVSHKLVGNWAADDIRIASAFNELRAKLGLPKSKRTPYQKEK